MIRMTHESFALLVWAAVGFVVGAFFVHILLSTNTPNLVVESIEDTPSVKQIPLQSVDATDKLHIPNLDTPPVRVMETTVSSSPPQSIQSSDVAVLSSSAFIREDNPLIVDIHVTLDQGARVYIEYGNNAAGWFRTPATQNQESHHVVPVLRLRPETAYSFKVLAVNDEGREFEGTAGTFSTGALPEALATLEFSAQGKPSSDLVLLDHRDEEQAYIVVIDDESNIVWYYASPNPIADTPYGLQAIQQKTNYNLVYYLGRPPLPCCLREITPAGEIVDSLSYSDFDGIPHHDHIVLSDNTILYLAWTNRIIDDTANGGESETVVEGDALRIWDQNTGITHEIWNAFDALSTDTRLNWTTNPVATMPGTPSVGENLKPIHWTFGSSLSIGPRGNYILALKGLNQIISIAPDLQSIEWKLGGPDSDFMFSDITDQPYNFHTVSQLPNGNILVFDNGLDRPEGEGGEFSRALELKLDHERLIAKKVWEYRPDPDVFARLRSSAFRLSNGNTFINFDTNPRSIIEVAPNGTEVWKVEMSGPRLVASYRAYPFTSIFGEVQLK